MAAARRSRRRPQSMFAQLCLTTLSSRSFEAGGRQSVQQRTIACRLARTCGTFCHGTGASRVQGFACLALVSSRSDTPAVNVAAPVSNRVHYDMCVRNYTCRPVGAPAGS